MPVTVSTSFHHGLLSDLLSSCSRCCKDCGRARRREGWQSDVDCTKSMSRLFVGFAMSYKLSVCNEQPQDKAR